MDKFNIKGRVAVVTGGTRGLGKGMAEALAEGGANIVIPATTLDTAQKTAAEIGQKYGVKTLAIKTNIADEAEVEKATKQIVEQFGKIDILVNNAGICSHQVTAEVSFADWKKIIDVNYHGTFLMSKAVGKCMIKQQKGSIINITSISGIIVNTPQFQAAYNSSKAAVNMLTRSLAVEWAPHNIRVNAIAPGYMLTDMTQHDFDEFGPMVQRWVSLIPMGRPGTPDELGGMTLYLASDASSYTTGGIFVIDGGYTAL